MGERYTLSPSCALTYLIAEHKDARDKQIAERKVERKKQTQEKKKQKIVDKVTKEQFKFESMYHRGLWVVVCCVKAL